MRASPMQRATAWAKRHAWFIVLLSSLSCLATFVLLSIRRCAAEPRPAVVKRGPALGVYRVTGSGLSVIRVPTINKVQNGVLVMDGRPFRIVEQGPSRCSGDVDINSRHEPLERLVSQACLFGPSCLSFQGLAAPSGCGPDRIEVDIASAGETGLHFGEVGDLRFHLRVDPAVKQLEEPNLISQTWQMASVAIGRRPAIGPAFSIALISNPRSDELVDVQFRYRNTVTVRDSAQLFLVHPIKKGDWVAFHVRMTPRYVGHPAGLGEILVWAGPDATGELEPKRALNYGVPGAAESSYRFAWGYPLDPETRLGDAFDVRVGIYRPEPLVWLKFELDGVELTRNKAN